MNDVDRCSAAPTARTWSAKAAGELKRRARQPASTGRELEQLDLQPVELPQRRDLVAHEAPALGVKGVRQHVRHHESAHVPPDRSALE